MRNKRPKGVSKRRWRRDKRLDRRMSCGHKLSKSIYGYQPFDEGKKMFITSTCAVCSELMFFTTDVDEYGYLV